MRGSTLCVLIAVAVAASVVNAQAPGGLHVADPGDCSAYYLFGRDLKYCPKGLLFNAQKQVCDWPANIERACIDIPGGGNPPAQVCQPLSNSNRSHWEPKGCTEKPSQLADKCRLVCDATFELSGSKELKCTAAGWDGTSGVNQIPTCKNVVEIGKDFINTINETLGRNANLLFVLDESGSVGQAQFDIELEFVKDVIRAFPLSASRSAGVITFSSQADVDITLREANTCNFLKRVGTIKYSQGGTDILAALNRAVTEIQQNAVHTLTLVFLITDGQSSTDATPAAEAIKKRNDVLFSIGVGGYDAKQLVPLSSVDKNGAPLFYGIRNFEVFKAVADYLKTQYKNNNAANCP